MNSINIRLSMQDIDDLEMNCDRDEMIEQVVEDASDEVLAELVSGNKEVWVLKNIDQDSIKQYAIDYLDMEETS